MEGKVVGMLAAFALIACFAGGLSYYFEIDSKQRDLSEAQAQLIGARSGVENKRAMAESLRSKIQALRDQVQSHTSLSDTKQSLTTQIANLETQKADVLKEFVSAVQKVRASSAGMPWPDVTLNSGQVLTAVTIQKVTDTDVSVTHSGGVSKIAVADLPTDLKERFRYGMAPMIQLPDDKSAAANAPTAADAAAAAQKLEDDKREQLKGVWDKIRLLQDQIQTLEKTRSDYATRATEHRALGISAQNRGRPSSVHYANAAAAEKQALAVNQQIQAVQSEINSLQRKAHCRLYFVSPIERAKSAELEGEQGQRLMQFAHEDRLLAEAGRRPQRGRHQGAFCRPRFTALSTPLMDASSMFVSTPAPQQVRPSWRLICRKASALASEPAPSDCSR
jgi:hypothetical protein